MRHLVEVAVEEPGVVLARLPGQRLDPGARRERRARLVERDVPVGADPEDLQVDPADRGDRLLVGRAGRHEVVGQPVGTLHGAGGEVDAGRDLLLDDVAVALGVVGARARRTRRA